MNFFTNKFNEIIKSPNLKIDTIRDPNDKTVALSFVKFACEISNNSRPINIEVKTALEKKYTVSCRFLKDTQLKWTNDEKGLENLIKVNELIFDDCCIIHEENALLVEIILNRISAPHFVSHYTIKVKSARRNFTIMGEEERTGEEQIIFGSEHSNSNSIVNNYEIDVSDISDNSETYIFNDMPLSFIKDQYDKVNVENFSRWARIFMEGQNSERMEISKNKSGSYVISISYPAKSFFSWNRLASLPSIHPFLFENMFIDHSTKNLTLTIIVKNSNRRLFVDKNSCELALQHVRTKRHKHLVSLATEIVYDENNAQTDESDESDDNSHKKNGFQTEKHRKMK